MAFWQLTTFAILIGALLVYASLITRRLASVDARLRKIEETVLAMSASIDSADAPAAEVESELSSGGTGGRGGYLTMRDLRISAEQQSSRAIRSGSWNPFLARAQCDTSATSSEPLSLPNMEAESGGPTTASLESYEAPATSDEPLNLPTMLIESGDSALRSFEGDGALATSSEPPDFPNMQAAESGDPTTVSLESSDAPQASSESQSPPDDRAPSDDSSAKKDEDTALFLTNQRRRRRSRRGY
jgi:hypothetical protein